MIYDAAVIGAGVTGAAVARELSARGAKVLLIEKEAEPAFGVSKSNSGIVHAGTQNPPASLKGRLCVEGNRLIREKLSDELALDFRQCGQLIVAFEDSEVPALERIKADGEALGVPGLRLVDRAWLDANEPNLNPAVKAALLAPTAGMISPYRFVHALVESALLHGAELKTGRRVTAIKRAGDAFELTAGGDTFRARYVVNAAGLYADEVSSLAGAPSFKISPRKGEEYLLDRKREHIANHIIFPLPSASSKGILMIKTSDGNPMIGPTAHETADKEDLSTTAAGLEEVLSGARRLVPSVSAGDIIAYFAGLRPACGKDFVIRREAAAPGFVNAAGIQSPGLTAAPAVAMMVAELLKSEGLELDNIDDGAVRRLSPAPRLQTSTPQEIRRLIEQDPAYGDIVCRCETVSAAEIRAAVKRGAATLDGVKFRTRAQAGRCHGGFCTARIMKIMQEELGLPAAALTKRGPGSEIVKGERL